MSTIWLCVTVAWTAATLAQAYRGAAWTPRSHVIIRILTGDEDNERWLRRSDDPVSFWIIIAMHVAAVAYLWARYFGWKGF